MPGPFCLTVVAGIIIDHALMAAGLDFKLTGGALGTSLPPLPAPWQRMQKLVSHPAGKVWFLKRSAPCGQEGIPLEDLQQVFWKRLFADPTQLWDNRRSKPTRRHPDFQDSRVALWLNNGQKPTWVDSQMPTLYAGMKTTPELVSTSVLGQEAFAAQDGQLNVGTCRKVCDAGPISDAVDALNLLVKRGCHVPNNLFYRVLKRCNTPKDLDFGRCIHALAVKSGYEGDAFLATHLMGLYASHGRLEEAMKVFTEVSTPNAHNWATIIFAYARHGEATGAAKAIQLYRQMRESTTVKPDGRIYSAVLKACVTAGDLFAGKEVHSHITASLKETDRFVQAGLVDMYAKCGSLEDARRVFDSLPDKNVVTWTVMIAGYAQQGMGQEALGLYAKMQHEGLIPPNSVTYASLLQACASLGVGSLHKGKQLHAQIQERGLQVEGILGGSLLNMYAKCGSLEDARRLFDTLQERSIVTWNAMIAGYAQKGMGQEALTLYRSMQQEGLITPNSVTYACLLQACASVGVGALHEGKQLHAQIKERELQADVVLGGSLVNMYAKCGSIEDAHSVFDKLSDRTIVTWNVMLAGYAQQGMSLEALNLYSSMQKESLVPPNSVTYVCLLQACASVGVEALHKGKQLHEQIKEQALQGDVVLGGSLVNMYAKCGNIDAARQLFDILPERTVVAWTAMLAGYAQQGMGQEALSLYSSMQEDGLSAPDYVTYVCLLQTCAGVAALPMGKQLHAEIEKRGMQSDVVVGAALVHMYAKCGSMYDSQWVFDSLPERGVEAWGALLSGYARQGGSEVVFNLLDKMKLEGIQPDGIVFLSLLTVCSHAGLVDKGRMYFESMRTGYSISPTLAHFTCMIDLLGRAGHLAEALQMAKTMPLPPDAVVWLTLLGACRMWNNVEIGQQAFASAVGLDEKVAASYVLMSNIYAKAEMWEEAEEMQARRKKCGAWKNPGQSWWTDMGGGVHAFVVGD